MREKIAVQPHLAALFPIIVVVMSYEKSANVYANINIVICHKPINYNKELHKCTIIIKLL